MTIKWCEYVVISTSHAHKGRNVAPTASHIYRLVGSISCLEGCRTPSQANMSESNSTHGKQGYDGVQPGVARGVRFSVDLSHTRAPSHADTAELRPCHPNHATTTALNERRSCGQERCLKLLAVKHEVVRRLELLRRRWR
jgi:hypothetical protein